MKIVSRPPPGGTARHCPMKRACPPCCTSPWTWPDMPSCAAAQAMASKALKRAVGALPRRTWGVGAPRLRPGPDGRTAVCRIRVQSCTWTVRSAAPTPARRQPKSASELGICVAPGDALAGHRPAQSPLPPTPLKGLAVGVAVSEANGTAHMRGLWPRHVCTAPWCSAHDPHAQRDQPLMGWSHVM